MSTKRGATPTALKTKISVSSTVTSLVLSGESSTGTDGDIARRAAAVTLLAGTFGKTATEMQLAGYEEALKDIPGDVVFAAAKRLLRTHNFNTIPTPSKIREACNSTPTQTAAQIAWECVCVARDRLAGETVSFEDLVINAVIRNLGGWDHVCQIEGRDVMAWTRRDFVQRYEQFAAIELTPYQTLPLRGEFAAWNSAKGYESSPPVLIPAGATSWAEISTNFKPAAPQIAADYRPRPLPPPSPDPIDPARLKHDLDEAASDDDSPIQ